MENSAVAQVFRDLAALLEQRKDNPFKIRAYRRAAGEIDSLSVGLEQLVTEGRLREIPGVGEAIAAKITEFMTTGRLRAYDKLRAELPENIPS
jgi:DNA polymerase (family 10)